MKFANCDEYSVLELEITWIGHFKHVGFVPAAVRRVVKAPHKLDLFHFLVAVFLARVAAHGLIDGFSQQIVGIVEALRKTKTLVAVHKGTTDGAWRYPHMQS